MPVMDGYSATRHIRENPRHQDLPVIAMTANVMKTDVAEALSAGMNDHIGKPINIREMFTTMAKWITPTVPAAEPADEPEASEGEREENPATQILHDLKHLNTAAGLERLGGTSSAYLRLLQKFADNQSSVIQEASKALGDRDSEKAMRLLHTLKGTAGSIGAEKLQELAAQAEPEAHSGISDAVLPKQAELTAALSAVLEEISRLLPAQAEKTSELVVSDEERLTLLGRLKTQLEDFDTEAEKTVDALMQSCRDAAEQTVLRDLAKAAAQYDFEKAAELLKSLPPVNAGDIEA
jgi:CheY-like chemotaxis protein